MKFGSLVLSSQSAPWYLFGCATALPDLILKCTSSFTLNLGLFPLKISSLIPLSLGVFCLTLLAERHQVAIRAAFLGVLTAVGLHIFFRADSSYHGFGMYMAFLAWFHFSEYFFIEISNPEKVNTSAFMLNHSVPYNIALACSVLEFFIEKYAYSDMKEMAVLIFIGFTVCVAGECLRKRAMYVCGPNFNHLVQHDLQSKHHTLVTHDVYRYIQHPSYTGWFIFTIGTQIILFNPVCLVAFPCVMYQFFEVRVREEEPALVAKHGAKYEIYREKTPRFIPLIW